MIPFLSNAHTHSTFCDGKNPLEEMIAAAKAQGFVSLGFSGHAHPGFDCKFSMTLERQQQYLQAVRALQPCSQGLRIWAGYELDGMTPPELLEKTRDVDYRIGSVHYLKPGRYSPAADGDPDILKKYTDEEFSGDGVAMAQHYYDILVEFVNRERPEIIGHFDLVRKYAEKKQLFDENDPAYRKVALNALERVFPSGSVLEINTGGMARGYLPTPYPTLELLCAWREMGGKVAVTSDCHDYRLLAHAFDVAVDLMKEAGFRSVQRLGAGDALWDEVEV